MAKQNVVFISGCWDLFHIGHLNVLKRAKELGDVLVVGVIVDEFARRYKGEPIISFEQRREIVGSLECVDYAVAHKSSIDYEAIEKYGVNIRAIGPTYGWHQDHHKARRELERRGIKHVILPKTPGISTTKIKEECYEEVAAIRDLPAGSSIHGCSGHFTR